MDPNENREVGESLSLTEETGSSDHDEDDTPSRVSAAPSDGNAIPPQVQLKVLHQDETPELPKFGSETEVGHQDESLDTKKNQSAEADSSQSSIFSSMSIISGHELPSSVPPDYKERTSLEDERPQPADTHTTDTIRVAGVDDTTDLELVQLYFENPRKSRGDSIRHIDDHRSHGFVLVTYKDPAVVDRVIQKPHSLYKKPLTVTAENQSPEEEDRDEDLKEDGSLNTVEVSGGTAVLDEELLKLYFESRRKSGGGNVIKVDVMKDAATALVTFEDPTVAAAVVNRKHTLNKTELTVVPYRPSRAPTASNKVQVTGLKSSVSVDFLELYFEKESDADVEDVHLKAAGVAVVTFADQQAAQRVLEKERYVIQGKEVTVTHLATETAVPEGTEEAATSRDSCSVEVMGIGPNTMEDTIELYFENSRRSGGGPVKTVQYEQGSGKAMIVFEEPEAAKRVLAREHTIDKCHLTVNLSTVAFSSDDSPSSVEPQGLTTVRVTDLPASVNDETLCDYFENVRRSSGGPVEDVKQDKKNSAFFITFKNATDAARVASRQHTLMDQLIDVQLYKPPETYKNHVLVGNLPEVRTIDELLNFVEAKSKSAVKKLRFADEGGFAVVEFESDIDLKQIQASLTQKPFKGHTVTVEPIPVSSTILVSNLPSHPHISDEILMNYFENTRRSGGGEVINVELVNESQSALITFKYSNVALAVTRREHAIQKCPVDVSIYLECLGPSGGSEEPVTIPSPLTLSAADCKKLSHLQVLPDRMNDLCLMLKSHHALLEEKDRFQSVSITCTLTPETEDFHQLVKSWTKDVEEVLQDYLHDVVSETLEVNEEEFAAAQDELNEMVAGNSKVGFNYNAARDTLQIVYKGEEQENFAREITGIVSYVQMELDRKKRNTTEHFEISREKLLLLKTSSEFQLFAEEYPNVHIATTEDDKLELCGVEEDIQAVKLKLHIIESTITSLRRPWESDLHRKLLLEHDAARTAVKSACSNDSGDVIEFTSTGFTVHSFDEERAEIMLVTAYSMIQQRVIKFSDDCNETIMHPEWRELKQSIQAKNEGLMVMQEDRSGLTIVSVSQSIQQDFSTLKDFLRERSVQETTFSLPCAMFVFFRLFLQNQRLDLPWNFDEGNNQITVRGNRTQTTTAREIYTNFRQQLTQKLIILTHPSMAKFLKTTDWDRKQKEIEHFQKCLILDPEDLPDDFKVYGKAEIIDFSPSGNQMLLNVETYHSLGMESDSENEEGDASHPQGAASNQTDIGDQPKVDLPSRPRIFLSVMSDITKEEHHVLVNSSNTALDMSMGQVSKAMLAVGGPGIQEELKTSYPEGLATGELAVSGGGKLMCKKLFHCCLPEVEDKEEMQTAVRTAVMKCLAEADRLEMGSIGFPSLGTGNLHYPNELVANTMFTAVLDYGREHPNTQISDVLFILHKKDSELTQAFDKEKRSYKRMQRQAAEVQERAIPQFVPSFEGLEAYPYFTQTKGRVEKVLVGLTEEAVDEAKEEMLASYDKNIKSVSFEAPSLEYWDQMHIETIKTACKTKEVDLIFKFSLGVLELQGFRHSLGQIPVDRTLKDAERDYHAKQNATMLRQVVEWGVIEVALDGEHFKPYDDDLTNYEIETAYMEGRPAVVVKDSNNVAYIINFAQMIEKPEFPGTQEEEEEHVTVIRKDKIRTLDAAPPKTWSPMNGQDLDVIKLSPSSDEYIGVADDFKKSLDNQGVHIVEIHRIQNLTLHKQYETMKKQIESSMKSAGDKLCERSKLWHGTKEEAVQGIINHGFNRSYCDLKKSAFGQGAYFAVKAQYASRDEYAKVQPGTMERNMFRCKVLVGQYKKGDQSMRTPPEISPGQRCHSTVDDESEPTIFVTYSDIQAYPQYLIKFRDD